MATSGSKSVAFTSWDTLKFSWWEESQSVANNTTTIGWKMELVAGTWGRIDASSTCAWSVTVNGTAYSGKVNVGIANNATKTLASGTTTIAHNSDGTKSFAYSFEQYFGITFDGEWIATVSGTGSGILDTIARASQPSCITWPDHTQNVGEFGNTISIHMNRKSSSFTHTVRYQFGSQSGTIATGVGTGTTWTIPLSLMNLIPNSNSGSGTIYVDTYNGSTFVGTKYCGFTATVPASVKPTASFVLEDITGVDDIYGSPVQGLSKIKITVSSTMAYSSPIASCSISANGSKYSGTTATTGVLKTSGSSTVSATVTDKRGRTGSVSYTMNVQSYSPPHIAKLTVHRCNSDGTANEQGQFVKVVFTVAVASMSNKNTANYILRYKKSADTTYTEIAIAALQNVYSVNDHAYILAASDASSYDIWLTVSDRHNTTSRTTSASTAFSLLHFGADGTSIGIGKIAEKAGTLEIGMEVEFKGKSLIDTVYPVGSIYLAYNHTNPGTLFPGTTWARIEGAFPWFTGATGTIGLTGGEREVTLTVNQIPAHNHGGTYTNAGTSRTHAWLASGGSAMGYDTVNAGGGAAHNNMPPYIQISAWRRTA